MINVKIQPPSNPDLSPNITVIGVGGGGGNAVNNMEEVNLEGCDFLICNTDEQALQNSICKNKVQLGLNITGGLGAGANPEVGRAAAEESLEEVLQYVDGANMVFVTAGMGGGTGTGAAPVIAKACRERGILTVGVVTKPFHFEGAHRMKSAEAGIEEMQKYVDTLIVIPNQNLFRIANENTTFADAFKMADGVLQSGVRGVTDLMVRPGLVNLDFADIRTAMMEMGKAMMGTGEAKGEKRAIEAAEAAINNPLLDDVSMKGARGVIINVTGGYDMTLFEADEACNRIRDEVDPDANIIFGATFDESMDGAMRVSIVATGIERESMQNTTPGTKGGASFRSGGGTSTYGGQTQMKRAIPQTTTGNHAPSRTTENITQQSYGVQIREADKPHMATQGTGESMPRRTPESYVPQPQISATPLRMQTEAYTPAPAQPVQEPATDINMDMFEQSEFSAPLNASASGQQVSGEHTPAQNTALRGERYKNAFIPPKPVTAGDTHAGTTSFHGTVTASRPVPATAVSAPGLKLNPPKLPKPEDTQPSRSLFDRITGTVQEKLEGIKQEYAPKTKESAPRVAPSASGVPEAPAQGQLDISKPAGSAKSSDLDIPAFLRRQAN